MRQKKSVTLKDCLQTSEKYVRRQGNQILHAKRIGVRRETIEKMIAEFELSKAYYDELKRKVDKENGK